MGPADSSGNFASGRGRERPVKDASCCFKPVEGNEARRFWVQTEPLMG